MLFTSDNGHHQEGGNDPTLFNAAGPLRGQKRDLYDGGIRVPTIARWPGRIRPGSQSDYAGYFADLFPTLAELANARMPQPTDGLSLVPTLLGKGVQRRHPVLYWEFHESGFSQAVLLDQRWKAIRPERFDAPIALYDQQTDPGEQHDVAPAHPELVARARRLFQTERTDLAEWPLPKPKPAFAHPGLLPTREALQRMRT